MTVTSGATSGISIALGGAGAVSGMVTEAGGAHHGLARISVSVFSPSTGTTGYATAGYATTAADGSCTVPGLPAGTDYVVCFYGTTATGGSSDASGYVAQCWQDQPTSGTPTPVGVSLGTTSAGINAALVGTA